MTNYTFTTRIMQIDFDIAYSFDDGALGLISIKFSGTNIDFDVDDEFDKLIEKEVRTHHEINHKQVIHLN